MRSSQGRQGPNRGPPARSPGQNQHQGKGEFYSRREDQYRNATKAHTSSSSDLSADSGRVEIFIFDQYYDFDQHFYFNL